MLCISRMEKHPVDTMDSHNAVICGTKGRWIALKGALRGNNMGPASSLGLPCMKPCRLPFFTCQHHTYSARRDPPLQLSSFHGNLHWRNLTMQSPGPCYLREWSSNTTALKSQTALSVAIKLCVDYAYSTKSCFSSTSRAHASPARQWLGLSRFSRPQFVIVEKAGLPLGIGYCKRHLAKNAFTTVNKAD